MEKARHDSCEVNLDDERLEGFRCGWWVLGFGWSYLDSERVHGRTEELVKEGLFPWLHRLYAMDAHPPRLLVLA